MNVWANQFVNLVASKVTNITKKIFQKMSLKRRAGTDLNDENWDQAVEPDEQGEFQKASETNLAKRTIKTAKRRVTNAGFGKDNVKSSGSGNTTNEDSSSENPSFAPKESFTAAGIMDDDNQMNYYREIKGLNQSVAEWIQKKVEQNAVCILTPIFDDYAKHLKTIQESYETQAPDLVPVKAFRNTKIATDTSEKASIYSKRCKVFVKEEKKIAGIGAGMLYLKKVEGSAKTELLVRDDTSLGNILLNILLVDTIKTQRVLADVYILSDAVKPTSVIIRFENDDEAEELLMEINKHKQ